MIMPPVPDSKPPVTNAFSKKIENHRYALALHFLYYNFVRVHQTLRCRPQWPESLKMKDVVDMLEA